MIHIPSAQLPFKGSSLKGSKSLSGSGQVFFWMILILASVFLIWALWVAWRRRIAIRREWQDLNDMLRRAGLSREEDAFIRRHLRRGKVRRPMRLMRSESAFVSFFTKQTQLAGQHSEFLIQSIQRKMFGSSPD